MIIENEVDTNLIYLENVILSLNSFMFDDDIQKAINDLQRIVSNKLYSFFPKGEYEITKSAAKLIYYLKKEEK